MGKPFQRKDRDDQDWYISYYEPGGKRIRRRIGPSKKVAEGLTYALHGGEVLLY